MRLMASLLGLAILIGGLYFFYAYSPYDSGLFPRCSINAHLGVQCPGCGSQRAIHDLLHLRLGDALTANALVVLAIPYVVLLYVVELSPGTSPIRTRLRSAFFGRHTIWVLLLALVVFTVGRNVV